MNVHSRVYIICAISVFATSCNDASSSVSLKDLYGVWLSNPRDSERISLTPNTDNSYLWVSIYENDGAVFKADGKFEHEKDLKFVLLNNFYPNGDFARLSIVSVVSKTSPIWLMRDEDQGLEKQK